MLGTVSGVSVLVIKLRRVQKLSPVDVFVLCNDRNPYRGPIRPMRKHIALTLSVQILVTQKFIHRAFAELMRIKFIAFEDKSQMLVTARILYLSL